MILCGYKSDPKDNAFYGFVYSSLDRGKTWHHVFEPKNSTFESEESCAFGTHGVAYYVSNASKVIDGELHHDQGTTRIYVSHDAGRTWQLSTTTGWTDWCTSVVDTTPGLNENRLYVFFNGASTFLSSLGQNDDAKLQAKHAEETGAWVGMISYKEGDPRVAGPFSTTAAASKENYLRGGEFPAPSIHLKDGSILTITSGKRRSEKNGRELFVEAVRTTPDRKGLEPPVVVVSSLDSPSHESEVSCGGYFLNPAAAYDSVRDKVYFLYSDLADKTCQLFLSTSTDGGRSWSKAPIYSPNPTSDRQYANPAIAVNKDGLLALMWRDNFRSGCWIFATSPDDGKSLSRGRRLGNCGDDEMKPSALSTAYLWPSFFQADPEASPDGARINLRNTRNGVTRNQDAIAVTPDGTFHAVWIDAGDGSGELRTAAISVTPVSELIEKGTQGLTDQTSKAVLLYGGNQFYDPATKLLTLDVKVRNNGEQPLKIPLKLAVPGLYKDFGFASIANADNQATGAGAVWDISSTIPEGALAPGATTKPFALKFHYLANPDIARASDDILGLNVRVYAKP
jgi:hypothetical protein